MKLVKGFDDYFVTRDGEIYSKKYKEIRKLKHGYTLNGYGCVNLCKKGKAKTHRISRLVAQHFIDNPENKPQVNHIDGNKKNNRVENLEWCTSLENVKHAFEIGLMPDRKGENAGMSKLKDEQVKEIYLSDKRQRILAKKFKVNQSTIHYIKSNKTWKHITEKL